MTLMDLLRALTRRWYIVLITMGAALGLAFLATRTEPVFHARAEVIFLAPASARYPNELVTSSESLILAAGIVAERINGPDERLKFGASTVNPIGSPGIAADTWIRLLDTGNQWVPAFEHQVILVDATDTSAERVEERVTAAAALVESELRTLEEEHGVDPINGIGLRLSPETPVITAVDGSGARAAGMTLVLGFLTTLALVIVLEVRSAGRQVAPETPSAPTRRGRRRRRTVDPPL